MAPSALAAPARVTTSPALTPAFSPVVHDYVSRCSPSIPLHVHVATGAGKVRVDGGRPRHGTFSVARRLRDGQAVTLRGRSGPAYRIRCISPKFPQWTATRSGPTQAGWYVLTPSSTGVPNGRLSRYVTIVDSHGVPVWWMRPKIRPIDARLLPNGDIAWGRFFGGTLGIDPAGAYEEHRLDGKLVGKTSTVGSPTDIHDMQRLANGDSLLISYVPRDGVDLSAYGGPANATVLDCEVQEITRKGRKVWSWNSKDHVPLSETGRWWPRVLATPVKLKDGRDAYDIVHLNSVDARTGDVVVSMRHTDAVYDIARPSGTVLWKLGGTSRAESLTLAGTSDSASAIFSGQHDARVLEDGTLTVHDNGTQRNRPPRALRFRIDSAAKTATLLEQVSDSRAETSAFAGSARRLPGGNWVTSWGGLPTVEELTPAGAAVFTLTLERDWFSYRAFPIPNGQLSRRTLNRAMEAMHPQRKLASARR